MEDNIKKKIEEQIKKLSKWKTNLKNELLINSNTPINLFLIMKEWLDKYEKIINIKYNNYKDLVSSYSKLEDINETRVFSSTPLSFNFRKELFPLNQECWVSFQKNDNINVNYIYNKGQFLNKILLFELRKYSQSILYGIFFYDKQDHLRQAYLKINDLTKTDIIINSFKEQEFLKILEAYKIKLTNDQLEYHSENLSFDLFIFGNNNKKINVIDKNNANTNNLNFVNTSEFKVCNEKENSRKIEQEKKDIIFTNNDSNNIGIKTNNNICNKNLENNNLSIINAQIFNTLEIKNIDSKTNVTMIKKHDKNYYDKKLYDCLNPKKEIKRLKRIRSANIDRDKKLKDFKLEEILSLKAVHKESTPGIIGLLNIGATCYMNATLQCFSNIKGLRIQLLNEDLYKDLEKKKNSTKKLSFSLAEVLKNLWENKTIRYYGPEHFKQLISEMNPFFKGIAANDPKDLILFLLETMHKELNNPQNINLINNNIVYNTNFIDVFNDFSNYYISKNKSIISDEFYGFNNSITTCGLCQISIHNVQSYNILFFPLEEIRKYKGYNFNKVNIYDCFDYYEKQTIYPSFYCNYCKQNCQAFQYSKLLYTPKTLIINLNRGKGIEFNIDIIFEEYLNLRKYIFFRDSPYYYELTGVICHFGTNDMGGHFIAFCKNSNNCEWYKYNDQNVTKSSFNEVKQSGLPYVLFYSYIEI